MFKCENCLSVNGNFYLKSKFYFGERSHTVLKLPIISACEMFFPSELSVSTKTALRGVEDKTEVRKIRSMP